MTLILEAPRHGLVEIAIEPRSAEQQAALRRALADAEGSAHEDQESGQWILAGDSEAELDGRITGLAAAVGPLNVGAPQVAYRETITRAAKFEAVHSRILGPKGEFAKVCLLAEPADWSQGVRFDNQAEGGDFPEEYLAGVRQGLADACRQGLIAGFPLTGLHIRLLDGAWHDVDSSPDAFRVAAATASRKLRDAAAPILLEPIMQLEADVPAAFAAAVVSDLAARRGQVLDRSKAGDLHRIIARAPLSNLFGHGPVLAGLTDGHGRVRLELADYAPLPGRFNPDPETFPPVAAMRA